MATATAKRKRALHEIPLSGRHAKRTALNMTRGKGENRATYYQPGIIDEARKRGVAVVVASGLAPPRKVHRSDLDAVYGQTHENAGDGKFIDQKAISTKGGVTTVTGAHLVNPYLAKHRSYRTLIAALQSTCPSKALRGLTGVLTRSRAHGHHIQWKGKTTQDDAVLVSRWMTREELWEIATEMNPALKSALARSKSQRNDVKAHLSAQDKFFQNLDVLRRARRVLQVVTGESEFCGGATPYSMPLEQCGFAIDKQWLTNGWTGGEETGDCYYRIAIGRDIPNVLHYRDWRGMDSGDNAAYLSDKVRKQCIANARLVA